MPVVKVYLNDYLPWLPHMPTHSVMGTAIDNDERITALRLAMSKIVRFCSSQRVAMKDEKVAQAQMETLLLGAGFDIKREHRLSAQDIPDFLISESGFSIVLEMKTRCQRMKILRQLERYSKHQSVDGIILLSATAIAIPPQISDTPAIFASMGRGGCDEYLWQVDPDRQ